MNKGLMQRLAGRLRKGGWWNGGVVNPRSGVGGRADKSRGAYFLRTIWNNRDVPETIFVESWVARHAVRIPVDDMFIRWRQWEDEQMEQAERDMNVRSSLARAMISARLFGTAVLVVMTGEDSMESELVPERVREGDLRALRVFDRYDLSANILDPDPFSPNFAQPEYYEIHPSWGRGFRAHPSRVIRFDGIVSPSDRPLRNYSQDWGVSILVPSLASIMEDATLTSTTIHLTQEASTPVVSVSGLREKLAGVAGEFETSAEEIGEKINELKSNHRLLMLDKELEEFTRVAVSFSSLPELIDRYQARVAAANQIPQTRFLGRSPAGLNATGESDLHNYVSMIEAMRENMLGDHLPMLDEVVARSAGIQTVPDWHWQSLIEAGDRDVAEVSEIRVNTLSTALRDAVIDEDEYRDLVRTDPLFENLPAGPAPEPDPMEGMPPDGEGAPFGGPPQGGADSGAEPAQDGAEPKQ